MLPRVITIPAVMSTSCMVDTCPLVRMAAIGGVSYLLNLYWELIPASTTAWLLSKLTGELAYDMSWPAVRCAVLEGLSLLVDNPHAQPVLKKALPQLASLLTDPSIKVREAMASLLAALSSCRNLHFYDIVPVDMMLDVMAHDSPIISTKIQALLVPTYFPCPEEGSARVAMLLKANPAAGQVFCQYLVSSCTHHNGHGHTFRAKVPIEHIVQLATDLKSHLLATCANMLRNATEGHAVQSNKKAKAGRCSKPGSAKQRGKTSAVGKRKKGARNSVADQEGGQVQPDDDDKASVVAEEDAETIESWTSILTGLAHVCYGLAGAVQLQLCGEGDVADVFPEDELLLLYEACPNESSRAVVLHITSSLPFLPASAAVRSRVVSDLCAGKLVQEASLDESSGVEPAALKTLAGVEGKELSGSAVQAAVHSLCSQCGGAKLVAMLLSSLNLRPSGTIHVPVGKQQAKKREPHSKVIVIDEDVMDNVCCLACGEGEPEESILLCDGCDDAYHMQCLRPAIKTVPEGSWFCHKCEEEIQHCVMGSKEALLCTSAALSIPEGRQALRSQGQYMTLLEGLQALSHQQGQLLLHIMSKSIDHTGDRSKADSMFGTASAIGLYCRAALHLSLSMVLEPDLEDGEAEEEVAPAHDIMGLPLSEGKLIGHISIEQALTRSVSALNEAVEMCEDMLDYCISTLLDSTSAICSSSDEAAVEWGDRRLLYCLEYLGSVLTVLADAQRLSVLDLGASADGVPRFCQLAHKILRVVTASCQGCVLPTMRTKQLLCTVLSMARQLAVQSAVALTAGTVEGEEGNPSPSLDQLVAEGPAGAEGLTSNHLIGQQATSLRQLDGLACQVLEQLKVPECQGLLKAVKGSLSSFLSALLDPKISLTSAREDDGLGSTLGDQAVSSDLTLIPRRDNTTTYSWLKIIAALVGQAVVSLDLKLPGSSSTTDEDLGGRRTRLKGGNQGTQTKGYHDVTDECDARGNRRNDVAGVRDDGSVSIQQDEVEAGQGVEDFNINVGTKSVSNAMTSAYDHALEQLAKEDPSTSLLCGLVLHMMKQQQQRLAGGNKQGQQVNAHKKTQGGEGSQGRELVQGGGLELLARVAADSWSWGGPLMEASLGAVYLMASLGFKGTQAHMRLRLSGSEVDTLLRLELLLKDAQSTFERAKMVSVHKQEGLPENALSISQKLSEFLRQLMA
ncbi:hypothetical protein CEUSTIGMA_g3453.t1 [Chlamydomonas eustigma]|uniref:PHD-type domain-containing protein n=1 Tax=Chlamydomonas eustigma TaxID=1157962 RepID=A0A250WZS6_9CHLO|nr:hypothetical protein CEUSTIGMA_g3453.t1 [Chlamydomonas eustigma]|eukprot:GAX76010.1 hypothetical protein CEUSTIGMA_g3453.t1 [Chlamydomonas eustigma]